MLRRHAPAVPYAVACALLALALPARAAIQSVSLASSRVALGERVVAWIELDSLPINPFDPAEVRADAMVARPDGTVVRIPAFWDRETRRALVHGREVIEAFGPGGFRVRYLPGQEGHHELSVMLRDASGQELSAALPFEVHAGDPRGFVGIDRRDPRALSYADGTAYVPVGANLCWSTSPAAGYDMENYLGRLADAGGNWSRLWLTHFGEGWTLEWGKEHASGYYSGLGQYSIEVASRLDRVFELAESRGIAIQLVLWQHSQLEADRWSSWADNPYNRANGGPASDSRAFFEHPVAVELSRRRIRYLVGRYAAYRSLLAWEVMNEADGVHAPAEVVARWCETRAQELRALDPHAHLITSSVMLRPSLAAPEARVSRSYDIAQGHAYGGALSDGIPQDARALRAKGKPALFAEFGLDSRGQAELRDPQGLHLAEGAWIALASGYWGGAMPWWWDSYLGPYDLWGAQQGLAAFTRATDLRGLHDELEASVVAEGPDQQALDVFGRRGDRARVLYVRHPDARWERAIERGLPEVTGARVWLPAPAQTRSLARVFDTSTGAQLQHTELVAGADGGAWLALPPFRGSVAIDVRPGAHVDAFLHASAGCQLSRGHRPRASLLMWTLLAVGAMARAAYQARSKAG